MFYRKIFEPGFSFLYIDANEDRASGGHAAMRLGEDVYHFQYHEGWLRMDRDDWSDFAINYRGLQNRTIHESEIHVSPATQAPKGSS